MLVLETLKLNNSDRALIQVLQLAAERHVIPEYARVYLEGYPDYLCAGCEEILEIQRVPNPGKKLLQPEFLEQRVYRKLRVGERVRAFDLFFVPSWRKVIAEQTGLHFIPQAYFHQAYEVNDGGPGGVISVQKHQIISHTTAAMALLFWQWRDEASFKPPLPEAEAADHLWAVIEREAPNALRWLQTLKAAEHRIPLGLRAEIYPLLGTPAWQRLLAERLGIQAALTSLNTLERVA